MKASEAQRQAKDLLKDVVEAVGWTEKRSDGAYIISDNASHPIDNIKTGYKSRKWASITSPSRDGKPIKLKIQTDWWEKASEEERVGLICHETTHLKVHSGNGSAHRPEFWEVNKMIYRKISTNPDFQNFDWEKIAEFAVDDPNSACVDRRSETVEERTEKMKEVRDYR